MTSHDIGGLPGFTALNAAGEKPVAAVYCADLLSWAMSRAPENSAWCTVMGNVNAVAVAALADVAALVICEGANLDAEALEKAKAQEVAVYKTAVPAFEAALLIAKAADIVPL